MPEYKFENVGTGWGAPMGRSNWRGDADAPYKFRVFRVRMVDGGYDNGGAYWGGGGTPLFCAVAEPVWCEDVQMDADACRHFLRAKNRKEAVEAVKEMYPNCRFFRS